MEQIDLYQIHYPIAANVIDDYAEVLAKVIKMGKVRAVGVSNFNASLMRAMHRSLAARGIPLASNQVAFNVFNRTMMDNGVLDACRELNLALIAYHPLAQGILTGKFRNGQRQPAQPLKFPFRFLDAMFGAWQMDASPEKGANRGIIRRLFTRPPVLGNLEPLFQAMDDVARRHDCSPVQVALSCAILTSDHRPGAGGTLVARIGAAPAFWLNSLSFLAVIASLILVRAAQQQARPRTNTGQFQQIVEGLGYLRSDPRMVGLFLLAILQTIFVFSIIINFLPAVASTQLNGDAETLGLIMASSGLGALLAVLVYDTTE